MRLADFIEQNVEAIVSEWEAFAASLLPSASGMTRLALRDHAEPILEAVAKDLRTAQSRDAQSEKSKGWAPTLEGAPRTAAQTHAVLRARSGFDINQLVAEYRALRASVLRLWMDAHPPQASGIEDLIRFNEAIDQAVAESVSHFHAEVERARDLLVGMLGHDMRSPLNTILLSSRYLSRLNAGEEVSLVAQRLIRSGASMRVLLDDLLDFNRAKLGLGIKVHTAPVDLAAILGDEIEQLRGAYPERRIDVTVEGDVTGRWDGARVQQVLRNLISNAVRHGFRDTAIGVAVQGEPNFIRLDVTNRGPDIDPSVFGEIFDPLKRAVAVDDEGAATDGMGLGLFIVREIVNAHEGQVEVHSGKGRTTFSVRLPRRIATPSGRKQVSDG